MTSDPTATGPLERALVDEVREELRQHGIVFWLDKDAHYTDVVDRLRAAHAAGTFPHPVVPFRGSYLEMMLALEPFANELVPERVLVHMPAHNEATVRATPMLELYEMGSRFRKALPTLVEQVATGLLAPADVKELASRPGLTLEQAERAIAAKLGERTGDLHPILERMGVAQVVESILVGDSELARSEADLAVLVEHLHRHLGFVAVDAERVLSGRDAPKPPEGRAATVREQQGWVRSQLAAWLLGMEFAHDLTRAPRTAAFIAMRGVAPELVRRCRELTEQLRKKHEDLYERLADEVGGAVAVADEARGSKPEDLGRIDTFKFEEALVLNGAIEAVLEGRWAPALAWATDRGGDASFWLKRDHLRRCEWLLTEEAARLGQTIDAHAGALAGSGTLEMGLERYASGAFLVDRAHRLFEQRWHDTKDSRMPHYADLLELVERMRRRYRAWADETARAFMKLCETSGFVPDSSVQQRTYKKEKT